MKASFKADPTPNDAKIQQLTELLPNSMQEACATPEIRELILSELQLGEVDIFHAIWRVLNRYRPDAISPSEWFG